MSPTTTRRTSTFHETAKTRPPIRRAPIVSAIVERIQPDEIVASSPRTLPAFDSGHSRLADEVAEYEMVPAPRQSTLLDLASSSSYPMGHVPPEIPAAKPATYSSFSEWLEQAESALQDKHGTGPTAVRPRDWRIWYIRGLSPEAAAQNAAAEALDRQLAIARVLKPR